MNTNTDDWCRVCLGFGYLPDLGPCPGCRLAAYADYALYLTACREASVLGWTA